MQTLLTSAQMRETDAYTIKHQPILSIDLMEKAAEAFVKIVKTEVEDRKTQIAILCGQGNNGGDGLAIARLLSEEKYKNVTVYVSHFSTKQSDDFNQNLKRLGKTNIPVFNLKNPEDLKLKADLIIDAILGSGLNKPLEGNYRKIAALINQQESKVFAVDVPTGLNTEGPIAEDYQGVKADLVISFQRPKINFFFPESAKAMSRFKVADIGLDEKYIAKQESNWKLTVKKDIQDLIHTRKNFTHKGTYGHALLIAGNTTTMGAALLAANACLHAGAGLTTLCLPESGLTALNTTLPEVMALPRTHDLAIETVDKYNSIAIGPGLGTEEENEKLLEKLIHLGKPLIIDADGLTILSERKDLLDLLPAQSILTPHLKEFDRLFGAHQNWWERVETARKEAKKRKFILVLKNQFTFICLPDGDVRINLTGNPAMASGGMGDVLTGILTSFVAQGYSSANAAIIAVYVHGKAGDQLAKKRFTVTASQVAMEIPKVIRRLKLKN